MATPTFRSTADFLKEADAVLDEVRKRLRQRKRGRTGSGTREQLLLIRDYLNYLRESVVNRTLPAPEQRDADSIAWMFREWDPADAFGQRVVALDRYFVKM